MRGRHSRVKKSSNKTVLTVTVLLILMVLATIGGLLAKYRSENIKEADMIAHDFHISSNYLDEGGTTYTLAQWQSGIELELYNYEKENEALVASTDITYTITAAGFNVSVKENEKEVTPNTKGAYTFDGEAKAVHKIYLTPKDPANLLNKSVDVTVKTTSPFEKILKAKLTLSGKLAHEYDVIRNNENGDYYEMTVYTNQYSGALNFTWPKQLVPDNTNTVMRTWVGNSGSYSDFKKLTTYKLIFFNPENKEFNKSDFSVTAVAE